MSFEFQVVLKLFLAMVLGGIIGWEREVGRRPAGLRTHVLVCLGATLITILSIFIGKNYSYLGSVDFTRIIAGIITGIGFLGAGAIIHAKEAVHGLTTAASIWLVAAIGIAIGCGFYFGALISVFFVMLVLTVLLQIEKALEKKRDKED